MLTIRRKTMKTSVLFCSLLLISTTVLSPTANASRTGRANGIGFGGVAVSVTAAATGNTANASDNGFGPGQSSIPPRAGDTTSAPLPPGANPASFSTEFWGLFWRVGGAAAGAGGDGFGATRSDGSDASSQADFMGSLDYSTNSTFTITGSWSAAGENTSLHLALLDVESLLDTNPNNDIPDGFMGTADQLVTMGIIDQSDILFRLDKFGPISESVNASVPLSISGTEDDLKTRLVLLDYSATPPIPEPETYALMLAGLGIIGFAARRRGKRELVG